MLYIGLLVKGIIDEALDDARLARILISKKHDFIFCFGSSDRTGRHYLQKPIQIKLIQSQHEHLWL